MGPSACPPKVRQQLSRLRGDGYVIQSLPGGSLALAGNGRDGTSFAVCRFLERSLGIRWLWPGENGEVVPKTGALRLEAVSVQQEPAYLWRDLGPGGALWGRMDKWAAERELGVSAEHQRIERLWEKRNGFGGLRFFGGHALGEILPPSKYGSTHPEYFALVGGRRAWEKFDGKHGAQPCTSNPDVVRLTAEYVERFFDQHPEYDAFSISLNDGGGFCECDRCRRLDSGAQLANAGDPEGGKPGKRAVITDRIITFANQLAELVARRHPDKKLLLFAYGPYKLPPTRTKFERLGSAHTTRVDARVIAATNRSLWPLLESGQFRADLFYRLNVFPIEIPPLRERREDIPPLVQHFGLRNAAAWTSF